MIRKTIITLSFVLLGSIASVVAQPLSASADDAKDAGSAIGTATSSADCKSGKILTFVPWYNGLLNSDCSIKSPSDVGSLQKFIWIIILNIVEDIFQAVGYVAAGFVMFGGFLFMTSTGNPDQASRGRKTLINAVIGLVVAISAGVIVNYIGKALGAV